MTIDDIIALAGAGFTKNDIAQLMGTQPTAPAPAPAPAPVQTPQPVVGQGVPPVPYGAMNTPIVTPPQMLQGQLQNPGQAAQAQTELLNQAFSQGNYAGNPYAPEMNISSHLPNDSRLTDAINTLTRAVQANGIGQGVEVPRQLTVDEMTAQIINPPSVVKER